MPVDHINSAHLFANTTSMPIKYCVSCSVSSAVSKPRSCVRFFTRICPVNHVFSSAMQYVISPSIMSCMRFSINDGLSRVCLPTRCFWILPYNGFVEDLSAGLEFDQPQSDLSYLGHGSTSCNRPSTFASKVNVGGCVPTIPIGPSELVNGSGCDVPKSNDSVFECTFRFSVRPSISCTKEPA